METKASVVSTPDITSGWRQKIDACFIPVDYTLPPLNLSHQHNQLLYIVTCFLTENELTFGCDVGWLIISTLLELVNGNSTAQPRTVPRQHYGIASCATSPDIILSTQLIIGNGLQ